MADKKRSKAWCGDVLVFLMGAGFLLTIPISNVPAANAGFGTMFVVASSAELYCEYLARRRTDSPVRVAGAQRLAQDIVHVVIPLAMAAMFGALLWHEVAGWITCASVAVWAAMAGLALRDTLGTLKHPVSECSSASAPPRE
jgi:hypothetical protein